MKRNFECKCFEDVTDCLDSIMLDIGGIASTICVLGAVYLDDGATFDQPTPITGYESLLLLQRNLESINNQLEQVYKMVSLKKNSNVSYVATVVDHSDLFAKNIKKHEG